MLRTNHAGAARGWIALLLLTAAYVAGCGPDDNGPARYSASGSVTYDGAPLASGRITFVPDTAKGNSGPAGYTMIHDGKYDTDAPGSKSPVAGDHKVLITGYDQSDAGEGEPRPPLFQDYEASALIDPAVENSTVNFDVPKQ